MEILKNWNKITGGASEFEMQEQVDFYLKSQRFRERNLKTYRWEDAPKIVLREFRVPEGGRISDHILLVNGKRAVNIESKLVDIGKAIEQAEDHLGWCDYSIICIPPDSGYIANHYIIEIIQKGLGLWYWFKDIGIFEFILPKYNRKKDKELRLKIIERIKAQNCT